MTRILEELAEIDAKHDAVNRPKHYQSDNGIECIDAIRAALNDDELFVAHLRSTAIKYLWRTGKKDDAVQDMHKAIWYMSKAVEVLRG